MAGVFYRLGSGDFLIAGDEGVGVGEARLDGREFEGGFVVGLALPDFGDPEDVGVGRVLGDDEAEAAGDGVGVFASHEGDEVVAAVGGGGEFYDESVDGLSLLKEISER